MCLMCLAKVVEASVISFAAVATGWAFFRTKYNLHKASKCDENGNCDCKCHCSCHKNECACDCHNDMQKNIKKKKSK